MGRQMPRRRTMMPSRTTLSGNFSAISRACTPRSALTRGKERSAVVPHSPTDLRKGFKMIAILAAEANNDRWLASLGAQLDFTWLKVRFTDMGINQTAQTRDSATARSRCVGTVETTGCSPDQRSILEKLTRGLKAVPGGSKCRASPTVVVRDPRI